jgi:hypothetical protein
MMLLACCLRPKDSISPSILRMRSVFVNVLHTRQMIRRYHVEPLTFCEQVLQRNALSHEL